MGVLILLAGCIDFYVGIPCTAANECPAGYSCDASEVCLPTLDGSAVATCPEDVVADLGSVQMDAYEASRPDATDTDAGGDESIACSRPGVLPWAHDEYLPEQACKAAGKHACTLAELEQACGDRFPYGDDYLLGACNDGESGTGDMAPTGSFVGCVDATGQVYDLVGNVSEDCGNCLGDGSFGAHGGNWVDTSQFYATCGGVNNSNVSLGRTGFRCCK